MRILDVLGDPRIGLRLSRLAWAVPARRRTISDSSIVPSTRSVSTSILTGRLPRACAIYATSIFGTVIVAMPSCDSLTWAVATSPTDELLDR